MGILDKIFPFKIVRKAAPITRPGTGSYVLVNGQLTWVNDNLKSYVVNGYQANDIIYSAVNLILEKAKVAPWGLYQIVDESAMKRYRALQESKSAVDVVECMRMRRKALEPITKYDSKTGALKELMKWPNENETWNDFIVNGIGYKLITGNKYVWANILDAGANNGMPAELWNLPAHYMSILATYGFPQRKTGFRLNNGYIQNYGTMEILHEKLWNPEYDYSGSGLYGQSPVKAAIQTLTRNTAAKQAGATQFQNNGAVGIAYIDDPVVPESGRTEQAQAVKRIWNTEYSGAGNYGKVAFSGYKMGYASVGTSIKDMALTDIEMVDLRVLASIWGIPSQLLNDPENKTYANQQEAEKALTSRCTLPYLISARDSLNKKIQTDWGFKGMNVYLDFDMSVYNELQEDQATRWAWVNQLPVSSAYKLELMGMDVPDDPNLDVILIPNNVTTLSDLISGMSDTQMQAIDENLNKAGLIDYLKIAK